MADLNELLARVNAAKGPDWRLAIDIEAALTGATFAPGHEASMTAADGSRYSPQPYTSSIDAALGLVERALPGWSFEVRKSGSGIQCGHPAAPESFGFPLRLALLPSPSSPRCSPPSSRGRRTMANLRFGIDRMAFVELAKAIAGLIVGIACLGTLIGSWPK